MKYTRIYATPDGSSRFEVVEIEFTEIDYVAAAPPLSLSRFVAAAQYGFMKAAAGWESDWHASTARNFFVVISGEWEVTAGDGAVRRFRAGDLLLVDDTSGMGHKSRVISDSLALMVELAAEANRNSY